MVGVTLEGDGVGEEEDMQGGRRNENPGTWRTTNFNQQADTQLNLSVWLEEVVLERLRWKRRVQTSRVVCRRE